jgi:hypothetical protein
VGCTKLSRRMLSSSSRLGFGVSNASCLKGCLPYRTQVKYFEFPRLNKRRVLLKHNISQSVSSSPDKNLDSVHLEAATSPVTTRPRHHATDSKIGFSHNLGYLSHYTVPVDTQNFVRHEVAPRIGCYCLPRL